MSQQLKIFEQQRVEFIESEERLAKLNHIGIIDSNGEYLEGIQDYDADTGTYEMK